MLDKLPQAIATFKRMLFGGRKGFKAFLASYCAILLIPALAGVYSYFYISAITENKIEESNKGSLVQIQKVLDERLFGIQQIAAKIATVSDLTNLLYLESVQEPQEIYALSKARDVLNSFVRPDRMIIDAFITLKNSDGVISTSGSFATEGFYNSNINYQGLTYSQWKYMLYKKFYSNELFVKDGLISGNPRKMVTNMQSIPYSLINQPLGNICIVIDTTQLESVLKSTPLVANGGAMIIMDRDNQIVSSVGDNALVEKHKTDKYDNETPKVIISKLKGDTVYSLKSEVSSWKYVMIYPSSVLGQMMNASSKTFVPVMLAALIISFVFAFFLAKRNYAPVNNILNKLKDGYGNQESGDMEFIQDAIASIKIRYNNAQATLASQLPVLRNNLFQRVLKSGYEKLNIDIEEALKTYGIEFKNNLFCVVAIQIECSDTTYDNEMEIVKYALANVLTEMVGATKTTFMVDMEWDMVAMVTETTDDIDTANAELMKIGKTIEEFMATHFSAALTVGIGSIHIGIDSISKSYEEAVRAIDYIKYTDTEPVFCYGDIQDEYESQGFSTEIKQRLINTIKQGDLTLAKAIINKAIDEAANMQQSKKHTNSLLVDQIIGYLKKNYYDINLNLNTVAQVFDINHSYLSHIFKENTGINFVDYVRKIKIEKSEELLANKDLTLEEVSEKVGYSSSGVFIRNFKREKGVTPGAFRNDLD